MWTEGGTWLGLFAFGSLLLAWGMFSLPVNGVVRGTMLVVAVIVFAVVCLLGSVHAAEHARLPSLDSTPRIAHVREVRGVEDAEHPYERAARRVVVDYAGADGQTYRAWLGDLIHESSIKRFTPESRWQIYAFRDPELADSTVLLAEAHEDVCRSGYMIDGVAGIHGFSSFQDPAPGSPFVNGKRSFAP